MTLCTDQVILSVGVEPAALAKVKPDSPVRPRLYCRAASPAKAR